MKSSLEKIGTGYALQERGLSLHKNTIFSREPVVGDGRCQVQGLSVNLCRHMSLAGRVLEQDGPGRLTRRHFEAVHFSNLCDFLQWCFSIGIHQIPVIVDVWPGEIARDFKPFDDAAVIKTYRNESSRVCRNIAPYAEWERRYRSAHDVSFEVH